MSDAPERVEVDGATITIGDVTMVVRGPHGEPATLDTIHGDKYVTYSADGALTLEFLTRRVQSDE